MKIAFGILALYMAIPLLIVGTRRLADNPANSTATTRIIAMQSSLASR
jgi:hypothetical protein